MPRATEHKFHQPANMSRVQATFPIPIPIPVPLSENHGFSTTEHLIDLRPVCKLEFVNCGAEEKYRKAEYVQRRVCFVNVQSSLHENVFFSVFARMYNAAYVIFIMWNSISGLDTCYHFRLNISCGVAVTVRSHKKKHQVTF